MRIRFLSLIVLAVLGLLMASASAQAARPIPGGRYASKTIALTVSDDGRGLSPQQGELRSFLLYRSPCVDQYNGARGVSWYAPDPRPLQTLDFFTLGKQLDLPTQVEPGPRPARLRIDARGRIAGRSSQRLGGGAELRVLTLRGRFVTRRRAVGRFRVQLVRRDQPQCDTGWLRFNRLGFTGERHLLKGSCNPAHTRTLLQTARGRIYEGHFHQPFSPRSGLHLPRFDYDAGTSRAAFGCLYKARKRYFIATTVSEADFTYAHAGPWSLSGRYAAAWSDVIVEPMLYSDSGSVINLADGRERHHILDACTTVPRSWHVGCHADSTVVNSAGSLAWISNWSGQEGATTFVCPCGRNTEVHRLDRSGHETLLDSGTGIKGASLRLHGSVLSWRNSGVTKTARLD